MLQAFTGLIDEFRVWGAVRSDEQLRESFLQGAASADPDLHLSWQFDVPGLTQNMLVPDSSGNNRLGMVGALPTVKNELEYSTGRPLQVPAAPMQLPSTAGGVSDGPVVVNVLSGENVLTLRSYDPDGDDLLTTIVSAPSSGRLVDVAGSVELSSGSIVLDTNATANKRVIYFTPDDATWVGDNFTYSVSDGGHPYLARVVLVRHQIPPAVERNYSFGEDELSYMVLGAPHVTSVTRRSAYLRVVITSLPARGTLYQACFDANTAKTYTALCKGSNPSPILAADTLLDNERGIVMFRPHRDEFSVDDHYTSFSYKVPPTPTPLTTYHSLFITPRVNDQVLYYLLPITYY